MRKEAVESTIYLYIIAGSTCGIRGVPVLVMNQKQMFGSSFSLLELVHLKLSLACVPGAPGKSWDLHKIKLFIKYYVHKFTVYVPN